MEVRSYYRTFNNYAPYRNTENIFLTGSIDALTNWSPDNALALNANNYPIWSGKLSSTLPDFVRARIRFFSVTVNIPASTSFEYKYIRKFNGAITWESDPNQQFTSPASGNGIINDVWR